MLSYLKADLYRIRKERLSGISLLLLTVFSILFAYLYREDTSKMGLTASLLATSNLIPLFFVTPAKIFFGEDLTNRTINNILIKSQSRLKVFTYKWLATLGMSFVYIIWSYGIMTLAHGLFSGRFYLAVAGQHFLYQLPIYLVIASLCGIIFNFFDRIYQSYMAYILIAMLFDQLFTMMVNLMFKTSAFGPYMMFTNLGQVDVSGPFFTKTIWTAFLFSVIYLGTSFLMFAKRDFK